MNLPKLSGVLAACVAVVLSLSACSPTINVAEAPELKHEASAEPLPPGVIDKWTNWTAEPKLEVSAEYNESIDVFSEELGLGVDFEQPAMVYSDEGWSGVAQYGSQCIIALLVDEQSDIDGSVYVQLQSRYDESVVLNLEWLTDYEIIRTNVTLYAQWCEDGGPIPLPDGIEFSPQEQSINA